MPTVRNSGLALLAAATIVGVSAVGTRCWGAVDGGATEGGATEGGATEGATTDRAVAASNWEIMEWTDPLTVSVDTASIERHAERVTARVLWDYTVARTTGGPRATLYRSMVGTLVFDCATDRLGAAGGTDYSDNGGDGESVAEYAIDPIRAPLSPTHPGTLGNDLVEYVCQHVNRRLANLR